MVGSNDCNLSKFFSLEINKSKKLKFIHFEFTDSYKLLLALKKKAIFLFLNDQPSTLSITAAVQYALSFSLAKNILLFPEVPVDKPTVISLILGLKFLVFSAFKATLTAFTYFIDLVFIKSKFFKKSFFSKTGKFSKELVIYEL